MNDDGRRIVTHRRASSVGAQSAIGRTEPTPEVVRTTLGHLADRVARRLRAAQRAGRTVTVRVRFADLRAVTRSATLPGPISTTVTLTDVAEDLVRAALADHPGERFVSLLAISVSGLVDERALQLELPLGSGEELDARRPGSAVAADRWALDHAMDRVRDRFGKRAVGYLSTAMSAGRSVPDEFRELAEHDV